MVNRALMVGALLALAWINVPSANAAFYDGNDLYKICEPTAARTSSCAVYIMGAADIVMQMRHTLSGDGNSMILPSTGKSCPFEIPIGATGSQLADVVTNYLRDHPETRHYEASALVWRALHDAFPCSP